MVCHTCIMVHTTQYFVFHPVGQREQNELLIKGDCDGIVGYKYAHYTITTLQVTLNVTQVDNFNLVLDTEIDSTCTAHVYSLEANSTGTAEAGVWRVGDKPGRAISITKVSVIPQQGPHPM